MKSVILFLLFSLPLAVWAGDYTEQRNLNLSSDGIERLEVDCGAGFLKVLGESVRNEIVVKAEIFISGVSDEDAQKIIENELNLSLEKRGKRAVLAGTFDRHSSSIFSFLGRNGQAKVNLTVYVPKNLDLKIDDGSGDTDITEISGSVDVEDGSGDLSLKNIGGEIDVEDGSGDLEIDGAGGDVTIDDGSGDVRVINVSGDVRVDDGSASLYLHKINGSVRIDDGSGSIEIDDVKKDVEIVDDGSGSVNIRNVQGKVFRHDD